MERSTKTARELFEELKKDNKTSLFGYGRKPMLVNVDLQRWYTDPDTFPSAYGTPEQIEHVNELVALFREKQLPIAWAYVAYMESGEDCGVWSVRDKSANALQNVKIGSPKAELDHRLSVDRTKDIIIHKRMPSAFHETNLRSLLVWHGCDTIVVTGGSTRCIRATVVDGLSSGYRMVVPEE